MLIRISLLLVPLFLENIEIFAQTPEPSGGQNKTLSKNKTSPKVRDDVRIRQEAHRKVRRQAVELISGILDVQLRELEDNGLESLPIHGEILRMKENLQALVETEMPEVIALLEQARSSTGEVRETQLRKAREAARKVVLKLAQERQAVLHRLKATLLVEQLRQLIQLQSGILEGTKSALEWNVERRLAMTIELIEDEKDFQGLLLNLIEDLARVITLGDKLGEGASDAVRILKQTKVEAEVVEAIKTLEKTQYPESAAHQERVLRGLSLILDRLEELQGLDPSREQEALALVNRLIQEQKEIAKATPDISLEEQASRELSKREKSIHRELGILGAFTTQMPEIAAPLEQARVAALNASNQLFEKKIDEALASEQSVLESLEAIASELRNREQETKGRSSDDYRKLLEDLASLRSDLEKTKQNPNPAEENKKAQERFRDAAKQEMFPSSLRTQLEQTADAPQEKLLPEIERSLNQVQVAEADAQRRLRAVTIGELSRAAESLERAAAAERRIADSESTIKDHLENHENARQVVQKVSEGVARSAPDSAKSLEQSKLPLDKVTQGLKEEGDSQSGKETRANAADAAEQISKAAQQIRDEIVKQADSLNQIASEQLIQLDPIAEQIHSTLDQKNNPQSNKDNENETNLDKAANLISQALEEQHRASGRPQLAEAHRQQRLAEDITRATQNAEKEREDYGNGKSQTPLAAVAAAQKVKELAEGISSEDSKQGLKQTADQLARNLLDGDEREAEKSSRTLQSASKSLTESSESQIDASRSLPQGNLDPKAQSEVSKLAKQALESLNNLAQESLNKAVSSSQEASKGLEKADSTELAKHQAESAKALAEAKEAVDQAQKEAQAARSAARSSQAESAKSASSASAPVDPVASERLGRGGEDLAQSAASSDSAQADQLAQRGEQRLEQARSSVAARQERVRRDAEIAKTISDLTKKQQSASNKLAEARSQSATSSSNSEGTSSQAQQNAAEAAQEFAETQRATGQGAEQVSGQEQVVNPPIREALDIASRIDPGAALPSPDGAPSDVGQPTEGTQAQKNAKSKNPKPGPGNLGNRFVPNSPEVTAEMMAGDRLAESLRAERMKREGSKQASSAQGNSPQEGESSEGSSAQQGAAEGNAAGSDQPGSSSDASEGTTSQAGGGSSKDGEASENEGVQDGLPTEAPLSGNPRGQTGTKGSGETSQGTKRQQSEAPWVAKLPPELREAIRNRAKRAPPKRHEERLKRYFEGL